MKLTDDFEDRHTGLPLIYMGIGAALFVITLMGVVVLANRKPPKNTQEVRAAEETESGEETVEGVEETAGAHLISGSKLTSDDLDFWHMYDEEEAQERGEAVKKKEEEQEKAKDPSTDGKHTKLVADDGTEEWVSINPYLTKHTYDFSGLVYQYPIMKYYIDSEKKSRVGVSVSKDTGKVGYGKLKKAGVDYAMIRFGSRGYGSGNIMLDEAFYENVRQAAEAGLDVGVTFYSQAVTKEEAVEEATRVIEGLQGFTITYPVVFDMEYVKNDTARVEGLSREQKTELATVFMQTIEEAGYKAMLYGDKDWLIRRVDLSKLIGYDVWFSQEADTPDYPYKFTMWEYTKSAKIEGIEDNAALSICFIDYSAK